MATSHLYRLSSKGAAKEQLHSQCLLQQVHAAVGTSHERAHKPLRLQRNRIRVFTLEKTDNDHSWQSTTKLQGHTAALHILATDLAVISVHYI
jgi:hypothetical protein